MPQHDTPNRHKVRYIEVDNGYDTPCWEWQMFRNEKGYGRIRADGRYRPAHAYYYEQRYGEIPEGLQLHHQCENTCCVNPDHLEPMTCAENIRRSRVAKLTPDQVEQIRTLKDTMTGTSVGEMFNIHSSAIYRIWNGKRWVSGAD